MLLRRNDAEREGDTDKYPLDVLHGYSGHPSVSVRMGMGMIVRLNLVLKIAQFFLNLLGLLFECLHALLDFGVLMAVLFDGHWSSSESE
jgi:hypothetical protein